MARFAQIVMTIAVGLTVGVGAQPKPNFTGRWVIVSPKEGAGQEQIVTHDAKTLTTEHAAEGPAHKMIYQLDGIERRQAIPSHGTEITMLVKAAWDGPRIVISTNTSYPNGMKTQAKETWSLDAQGRLVVDWTEAGPTGPADKKTIIYTKKKS